MATPIEFELSDQDLAKLTNIQKKHFRQNADGIYELIAAGPFNDEINSFWKALATKKGFKHKTRAPSSTGARFFMAEPV